MKNYIVCSIYTLVVILYSGVMVSAGDNFPITAKTDQQVDLSIPEVKEFTTTSGVTVFYLQDSLPHFSVSVSTGYGKIYENSGNAGISEMLANTLNMGGSKRHPGAGLHRAVESLGGQYGVNASWENTTISLRFLQRHAGKASALLKSIISGPNFDSRYVDNARSVLMDSVRRREDRPEQLAFEKLRQILFNGNGYGAVMTEKTLKSIDGDDLSALWKSHAVTGNMRVGVVTSLPLAQVKNLMEDVFSSIPKGEAQYYNVDSKRVQQVLQNDADTVFLIEKDIPQSTIVFGTVAPAMKEGNTYPLTVGNYILGAGSFSSRLMREIRVKRGLAYSVSSIARYRKNTGIFLAYAQTGTDTTKKTINLIDSILRDFAANGPGVEEIKWAKESVLNSYIFEFDSPYSVIRKSIWLDYNQLPDDYLEKYSQNIQDVSGEEVLKEFNTLFKKGFIRVVVGNGSLKKILESSGKVKVVKLE
ncbi:MAG: M16 family metallopeptidase [Spirochaetota bacterium]